MAAHVQLKDNNDSVLASRVYSRCSHSQMLHLAHTKLEAPHCPTECIIFFFFI